MHSLDKEEFFKLNGYIKFYATRPDKPRDDGGVGRDISLLLNYDNWINSQNFVSVRVTSVTPQLVLRPAEETNGFRERQKSTSKVI